MLSSPPDIYILTPSHWDPHSEVYAWNEEAMLDWSGQMKQKRDRSHRVIIPDLPEDAGIVSSLMISDVEQQYIDQNFENSGNDPNSATLYDKLKAEADMRSFKISIGSTVSNNQPYVMVVSDDESSVDDNMELSDMEDLVEDLQTGDDLQDNFYASSTTATNPRGVIQRLEN